MHCMMQVPDSHQKVEMNTDTCELYPHSQPHLEASKAFQMGPDEASMHSPSLYKLKSRISWVAIDHGRGRNITEFSQVETWTKELFIVGDMASWEGHVL
ncbi:hypothetical protein ABG768_024921 [Culter alburnus]|uniref:Uncharacterized protein n=1 Tax=Culter alburnus TaxID=194366 RepID=A0AAW2AEX5_CULAL